MKIEEPAIKSYYFGKGYVDLAHTIIGAFNNVLRFAKKFILWIKAFWQKKPNDGFITVLWLIPSALVALFCCGAAASTICFGIITAIIVSIFHIVILAAIMAIIYIGFSIVWLIDRLYLEIKKISSVCPACHERYLVPTYRCSCGREHKRLIPGKYGIFYRTCECGKSIGTSVFTSRGKGMTVVCPNPACHIVLSGTSEGTGKVPICIPVIGGRSSGKSVFITAFTHMFREDLSQMMRWTIEEYDNESAADYRLICNNYESGNIRQTDEFGSIQHMKVSSIPVRFVLKGPNFKPARELHIFDVAGESFVNDNLVETQRQYEYCHGIVMMLDPFAIRKVWKEYEEKLVEDEKTFDTVSTADALDVSYSLLEYIQRASGLNEKEMSDIPLAVVIGKIDAADLAGELGEKKVRELVTMEGDYSIPSDVEDYICRKFLVKYGAENLLTLINSKFKNNRFFACSAMGHTLGEGKYKPIGVMRPMEWLLRQADKQINAEWKETEFTKKPFAMKYDLKTLRDEQ